MQSPLDEIISSFNSNANSRKQKDMTDLKEFKTFGSRVLETSKSSGHDLQTLCLDYAKLVI